MSTEQGRIPENGPHDNAPGQLLHSQVTKRYAEQQPFFDEIEDVVISQREPDKEDRGQDRKFFLFGCDEGNAVEHERVLGAAEVHHRLDRVWQDGRVPAPAKSYQGQVPQMKNDNDDYVVIAYLIIAIVLCTIISVYTPIGASPIGLMR